MANDFVQRTTSASPGAIEHLLPRNATLDEVELSIVIPAMNEEITVGEFIEWCKEGLTRAGVAESPLPPAGLCVDVTYLCSMSAGSPA